MELQHTSLLVLVREGLVLPVPIFQVRPIRLAEPTAGRPDIAMLEGAALPFILDAVLTRRRLLLLTGFF